MEKSYTPGPMVCPVCERVFAEAAKGFCKDGHAVANLVPANAELREALDISEPLPDSRG